MRLNRPTHQSAGDKPARSAAFTLIELMVVLVLIGILTAMVIPEMRGTFEDALLRSTGRELMNVVELASSRAVSLNQTLRLHLDATSGQYEVERQVSNRGGDARAEFESLRDVAGSRGHLDRRIAIQIMAMPESPAEGGAAPEAPSANEDSTLKFYADGTADGALLVLKDRTGVRLGLKVSPITARVTIMEHLPE